MRFLKPRDILFFLALSILIKTFVDFYDVREIKIKKKFFLKKVDYYKSKTAPITPTYDESLKQEILYCEINGKELKISFYHPFDRQFCFHSASMEIFTLVPGIGVITAMLIVTERNEFGPFLTWQEVQSCVHLSKKQFSNLRRLATLECPCDAH